jgi:hypothetical protein
VKDTLAKKGEKTQMKNHKTGLWALLINGKIDKVKRDGEPYKGVKKLNR